MKKREPKEKKGSSNKRETFKKGYCVRDFFA
jgi:hypothetical protein